MQNQNEKKTGEWLPGNFPAVFSELKATWALSSGCPIHDRHTQGLDDSLGPLTARPGAPKARACPGVWVQSS